MKKQRYLKGLLVCSALLLTLLLLVSCSLVAGDGSETTLETWLDTIADTLAGEATQGVETEITTEEVTQAPTEETQGEATVETQGSKPKETEAATTSKAPAKVEVAQAQKLSFNKNVTINQSGGSANVTAQNGLTYTATGYSAVSNGRFTINKGFTMTLDPSKTVNQFNRITLCYVSTQPLKMTVNYTEAGKAVTDTFYLEAGENTFSCLTKGYLERKYSKSITSISLQTCNGQNANFVLCLLKTEQYKIYSDTESDTYYIENDRYKLGVRLLWGGGINYLRDKDGQRGMTNLINQADTGRLVQQSYYGTKKEGSYQAGYYNNSEWKYNPVQGGDMHNNHSRIIDIVVNDYSVYVKAQPQDWSLNNQLTPSYMENSYTLYEDYIKVDNRFVDFSGMNHPYSSQELPAFYTVSALSRFYWYDGSAGWSGDTLSYRDDLNFWGDPKYHNDCTTFVRRSNTETWCAWVDPSTQWGIGLYVPNVDSLLAGKFSYNGSKDPLNGATNYVAPVNNMKIVPYEALEYSYLMATGDITEIRQTFKDNRNFATNASLHKNYQSMRIADIASGGGNAGGGTAGTGTPVTLKFNSAASIGDLNAVHNATVAYDSGKQAAKLTATGDDTQVLINYAALGSYSTSKYTTLVIEYMIPTTNSRGDYNTDLFVCAGSYTEAAEGCRTRQKLVRDGQWHTLTVTLSGQSFWTGNLNKLRFDFFDVAGAGDVMYVRSITLK